MPMVKFRNKTVHLYYEIDDKEVYKILQQHLNDFQYLGFTII